MGRCTEIPGRRSPLDGDQPEPSPPRGERPEVARVGSIATSSDFIISARGLPAHGPTSSHRFICLTPRWPRGVSFRCRQGRGSVFNVA